MPDSHFLFCEWDALFQPDWLARATQAVKDTPSDFDFLFLGSCCCKDAPRARKGRRVGRSVSSMQPLADHRQESHAYAASHSTAVLRPG